MYSRLWRNGAKRNRVILKPTFLRENIDEDSGRLQRRVECSPHAYEDVQHRAGFDPVRVWKMGLWAKVVHVTTANVNAQTYRICPLLM
jgi:hypothetical protein